MQPPVAVSFDLFGTLVDAERPTDPASAVAEALRARGVSVPPDWSNAYRTVHEEVPAGVERPLSEHVAAALASRDVTADSSVVEAATLDAFDRPVGLRDGAGLVVERAQNAGPVAVLSNCSVPGLVDRTLAQVDLPEFDAVVSSVECGWRKPDPRAFRAVAAKLGVEPSSLTHVGDDPETDGGVDRVGGDAVILDTESLQALPQELGWDP
jgi:HAD superfamily hydrolase (TIGR01549 family)